MEQTRVSRTRWILVPLFALLGLGVLMGSARAEDSVSVENTNINLGDSTATSGDVDATVTATVNVGPSATTSDGGIAISRQRGDNTANVNQNTTVKSGDSVSASQVTGVVSGGGGSTSVQNTNLNTGTSTATSGTVNATVNSAVNVGPSATTDDGGVALARQTGNNTANVTQNTFVGSGDAVSASQVTGIVGGGDVSVENFNLALGDSSAVSGDVNATVTATVNVGPSASTDDGVAIARQRGNNTANITQSTTVKSGDAVSASQITGVVGGDALIDSTNLALGNHAATSGGLVATVVASVNAGPSAATSGGVAITSQTGNDRVTVTQTTLLASGDAVSGSQVSGIVGWWRSWLRL